MTSAQKEAVKAALAARNESARLYAALDSEELEMYEMCIEIQEPRPSKIGRPRGSKNKRKEEPPVLKVAPNA